MSRLFPSSLLIVCLLPVACVKRLPVSAGGDRKLEAGEQVTLGAHAEVDAQTRFVWSMGDGTELRGPRVTHAWHLPGTYQVGVTVTDPDGQERSDRATVTVSVPGLLDVLPATTGVMLRFDAPAERMKDVPLFLERLLVSGREANLALNAIQEALGFDPFSDKGLRAAGLDPAGGIALLGLVGEGASDGVSLLVAAVSDHEVARETFRRLFDRQGLTTVVESQVDPAIAELRREGVGTPDASMTLYRGHLWVATPVESGANTTAALQALRTGEQAGLRSKAGFVKAEAVREQPGAIQLYLSPELVRNKPASTAGATEEEQRIQAAMAKRTTYLRADLDVDGDGLRADAWLGLTGAEVPRLAEALRARNSVPDFGAFIAPDQHLVIKLSVDMPGLWKTVLDLGGQGNVWSDMMKSMDSLSATTGFDVHKVLLQNLGDNYLLALRVKPAGVLSMVSGGAAGSLPDRLFEAVLYVQLREPDLLKGTIEQLASGSPLAPVLRREGKGWSLAPGRTPLVMAIDHGFLVLATSRELLQDANRRMEQPREKLPDWPGAIAENDHQVAFADIGKIVSDLTRAEISRDDPNAAMAKAMMAMTLGKLEALGKATLDLRLQGDVMALSLRVTMR